VPSAASETVAYSSRTPQIQRSPSSGQAQDKDSPFALMLEASAPPPADPEPRQTEPVKPADKTAAAPADTRKPTASDTPEKKATDSAEPANGKAAPDDKAKQEAAAGGETPVVDETLPDVPLPEETTEQTADADAVVIDVQADVVQAQIPTTLDVAIAAPAVVAPDPIVAPPAEGEAEPDLMIKPVAAGGAPVIAPTDVPDDAPVVDAPDMPVVDAQAAKAAPDIKGTIEVKPTEQPAPATEQAAETEVDPQLALQTKAEQTRPQPQMEETRPQQVEAKPQGETQPAAETPQKPSVTPQIAAPETDILPTPLPAAHQPVASDVASLSNRATQMIAQAPVPVAGIAVEIAAQARAGNNRFEIRLDPPELGRIDVRLDVDQEGNVKSRLVIERSDTYDLLRRDSSTLERALQQAGLKTSDNGMEFTLRDQGSTQRDARDQDQRNAERGIIPDADILPAEAASGYARVLGLGSGVDIRI
jgi:flagellar hook-length control protein FliK